MSNEAAALLGSAGGPFDPTSVTVGSLQDILTAGAAIKGIRHCALNETKGIVMVANVANNYTLRGYEVNPATKAITYGTAYTRAKDGSFGGMDVEKIDGTHVINYCRGSGEVTTFSWDLNLSNAPQLIDRQTSIHSNAQDAFMCLTDSNTALLMSQNGYDSIASATGFDIGGDYYTSVGNTDTTTGVLNQEFGACCVGLNKGIGIFSGAGANKALHCTVSGEDPTWGTDITLTASGVPSIRPTALSSDLCIAGALDLEQIYILDTSGATPVEDATDSSFDTTLYNGLYHGSTNRAVVNSEENSKWLNIVQQTSTTHRLNLFSTDGATVTRVDFDDISKQYMSFFDIDILSETLAVCACGYGTGATLDTAGMFAIELS